MSDVLQEMTEAVEATIPGENSSNQEQARAAEDALLRHLAREAVLAGERDACAVRHEQLTRALIAARQQREELARAVELAGGKLPQWEV